MKSSREDVVREALTWEGTRYHHRARVKGPSGGVDCANMPAAVYECCGLVPHIDPEYSPQWMMHRDEEMFLGFVLPYCAEIPFSKVGPGDLLMYKFGRTFSHSAIVLDLPEVLHASISDGAVVRANIERDWMFLDDRPVRCFTLWS